MSKRYGQKLKALKEARERRISGYLCPCPECGERDTRALVHFVDDSSVPEWIDIGCERCGPSVVEYDWRAGEFHVKRDGAPYMPDWPGISLTEYHRFDPSAYPNEEDAIRAEVGLLGKCLRDQATTGCFFHNEEFVRRRSELTTRSLEIGMKDFVVLFVTDITQIVTNSPEMDFEMTMEKCFRAMEGCDIETKCEVMAIFCDRAQCDEGFDKASERLVIDIADDLEAIGDTEEYIDAVMCAYRSIKESGCEHTPKLIGPAISHVERTADADARERLLIPLYAIHVAEVGTGPGIDEEMELLYERHETYPDEFIEALVGYGKKNAERSKRRAKISEMSTCALEKLKKTTNKDTYGNKAEYNVSELHYMRYRTDGNTDDLVSATEHMMRSSVTDSIFELEKMYWECMGHPHVSSYYKSRFKRLLKEKGLSKSRLFM